MDKIDKELFIIPESESGCDDKHSTILINEAVISQLEGLFGKKIKITFSKYGGYQIQGLKGFPKENIKLAYQILEAWLTGTYRRKQFVDYKGNGSNYDAWLKKAKDTFLLTSSFNQLLTLSDYNVNGYPTIDFVNFWNFHNNGCELSSSLESLGNNNITNFRGALDLIYDPYVLLYILKGSSHYEEIDNKGFLVYYSPYSMEHKLAISLYTKELFYVKDGKLELIGNSYEFLFSKLRLPMKKIINSALYATGGHLNLPSEGEKDDPIDGILCYNIEKALSDPGHKEAENYMYKPYIYRYRR